MKIGGSVWTYKKEGKRAIRKEVLKSLGKVLADDVVVLGAGSVGHGLYGDFKKGYITWAELHRLSQSFFLDALNFLGKQYFPIHPCSMLSSPSFERIGEMVKYVKNFATPCIHSDLIGDQILSGDDIALALGKMFREPVVFLVDVDGVLINGNVLGKIERDEIPKIASKIKATDITGGMKGKLIKIHKYGIPCWIINGLYPERLRQLKEEGETFGTYINV